MHFHGTFGKFDVHSFYQMNTLFSSVIFVCANVLKWRLCWKWHNYQLWSDFIEIEIWASIRYKKVHWHKTMNEFVRNLYFGCDVCEVCNEMEIYTLHTHINLQITILLAMILHGYNSIAFYLNRVSHFAGKASKVEYLLSLYFRDYQDNRWQISQEAFSVSWSYRCEPTIISYHLRRAKCAQERHIF